METEILKIWLTEKDERHSKVHGMPAEARDTRGHMSCGSFKSFDSGSYFLKAVSATRLKIKPTPGDDFKQIPGMANEFCRRRKEIKH